MLDKPLLQHVNLPFLDTIHPQCNRFGMNVKIKATGDSKCNDSPAQYAPDISTSSFTEPTFAFLLAKLCPSTVFTVCCTGSGSPSLPVFSALSLLWLACFSTQTVGKKINASSIT